MNDVVLGQPYYDSWAVWRRDKPVDGGARIQQYSIPLIDVDRVLLEDVLGVIKDELSQR